MKKLIPLLSLILVGCASMQKLPPINAESFVYQRHDPAGGTTITAKGVKTDGAGAVSADEAEWLTTYPQFGIHVKVIGYKQSAK